MLITRNGHQLSIERKYLNIFFKLFAFHKYKIKKKFFNFN